MKAFEIGPEYITIEFSDGSTYRHTYASAGRENVEHMKGLAQAGQEPNAFLSTTVSKLFERKEK